MYRAHDARLGREVALKVLPDEMARDPERRGRFEREARVLASLNHPNIATLHGFEQDGDTSYLVMELVEGETLAERITRGAISVGDARPLFLQVADALEAAHERGVIHRDLKPANIMVLPDGRVKLLDFGLAKAMSGEDPAGRDVSTSPTLTVAATQRGEILGTAGYMAPEQARGAGVDKRADIWAFGGCLLESLTGQRVFPGDSAPDILAAVLRAEPDFSALPADVSSSIAHLLQRCLTKDRQNRLRDIGEARVALAHDEAAPAPVVTRAGRVGGGTGVRPWWLAATAVIAVVAAAGGWWMALRTVGEPQARHRRFTLDAGSFIDFPDEYGGPVISPDATMIAFVDRDRLFVRDLANLTPRELPDTAGAQRPFWSPDSNWVGYFTGTRDGTGVVRKVPVTAGASTSLASTPFGEAVGASWSTEDEIIVALAQFSGEVQQISGAARLFALSANGSTFRPFDVPGRDRAEVDSGFNFPHHLRDRETLLAVNGSGTLVAVRGNARWTLVQHPGETVAFPVSGAGYVVYQRDIPSRGIWGVRFDPSHPEQVGEPFQVSPVGRRPSLAADGTLVYSTIEGESHQSLTWVDRSGVVLEPIPIEHDSFIGLQISPDGTRLAVSADDNGNFDIWTIDLRGGTETRLTVDPAFDADPAWSPTGDRVVFTSPRDGRWALFLQDASGRGALERLPTGAVGPFYPKFEPGGNALLYFAQRVETDFDIWRYAFDTQESIPLIQGPDREFHLELSPDGQLLLYSRAQVADPGGRSLYLTRYPSLDGETLVAASGARVGLWSPKGDEIFYSDADNRLVSVPVETAGTVRLGTPEILFEGDTLGARLVTDDSRAQFATPDGERFVVVRTLSEPRVVAALLQDWMPDTEE